MKLNIRKSINKELEEAEEKEERWGKKHDMLIA